MKFSANVGNEPVDSWLNFGGDPCHHLDTEIVFWIRYYWEIGKLDCAAFMTSICHQPTIMWQRLCCMQRAVSPANDIMRLVKAGLGRGLNCPSAS